MRLDLPPVLRRRFHAAWAFLPADVRERLRPLLVARTFTYLSILRLRCEAGGYAQLDDNPEVIGLFWWDGTRAAPRLLVYLHVSLAEASEPVAVEAAIHELAHAVDFLDRRFERRRLGAQDELAACNLVNAWVVAQGSLLARAIRERSRAYHGEHCWCLAAPTWYSDDDKQEDALLIERYSAEDQDDEPPGPPTD